MPKPYLAVVEFERVSGIPEDKVTNSFAFIAPDATSVAADLQVIGDELKDFYTNNMIGQVQDVANYLSDELSRAADATKVKLYDLSGHLDGSPHGSPVGEETFTLIAGSGADPLPSEVALCCTLRANAWESYPVEAPDDGDPDSGPERPRQRRTGRIYLGPLNQDTMTTVNEVARPTAQFRTDVHVAFENMQSGLAASDPGYALCVWSRANAALHVAVAVQTDDAFDTQRRRGPAATARTTVAI